MPRHANGRPGANPDRTAADSSHDGDGWRHSASLGVAEDLDTIAGLVRQLERAANCCGSVPLRDGREVQISRVASGYAVGPRR